MIRLHQHTEQSYRLASGSVDELASALLRTGWEYAQPRNPHEHSRWWRAGAALIVLYHSGAVLVQGREPHRGVDALRRYIVD